MWKLRYLYYTIHLNSGFQKSQAVLLVWLMIWMKKLSLKCKNLFSNESFDVSLGSSHKLGLIDKKERTKIYKTKCCIQFISSSSYAIYLAYRSSNQGSKAAYPTHQRFCLVQLFSFLFLIEL